MADLAAVSTGESWITLGVLRIPFVGEVLHGSQLNEARLAGIERHILALEMTLGVRVADGEMERAVSVPLPINLSDIA